MARHENTTMTKHINSVRNHSKKPLKPSYPHRSRREAITVTDAAGNHRIEIATADLLDPATGEAIVRCTYCRRWERHILPADVIRIISRDAA